MVTYFENKGENMKIVSYILAIITFCLLCIVLVNYEKPSFVKFDTAMSDAFFGNDLIIAFHYFGETTAIIFVALILLFVVWLKQRNYRGMLFILLTIGMGRVWNQLLKNWIDRPRPEIASHINSFSFPSSHAMLALLYLLTMAYLLTEVLASQKKAIIIWGTAILLSIMAGLSRIAERHNFATDVIAGWCIGYTWFIICIIWYEQRKRKLNKLTDNTLH